MSVEQWAIAGLAVLLIAMVEYFAYRVKQLTRELNQRDLHLVGMMRRGIYRIDCLPTSATYYVSTRTNFMARWGQHVRDLNTGRHVNARLQADWNQYGCDAFAFHIVEVIADEQAIIARENEILDYRAMYVPMALNYNQARTKTYSVTAAPDVETVIVERKPSRTRNSPGDPSAFSLEDLGLTPEEIAALEQA